MKRILSRRDLLATAPVGLVGLIASGASQPASSLPAINKTPGEGPRRLGPVIPRIRAIAFDAFVLFNPASILAFARQIDRLEPASLVAAASAKLFADTWFYTSAGRYAGFDVLAADAFTSAARARGIELDPFDCQRLVGGYSNLTVWPDVPETLAILAGHGIRLAMLSNLSEHALRANLRGNQIEQYFEFVLSTDQARQFKPAPAAYALAIEAFRMPADRIGFAASARPGWRA
jgi:2-haloacid dehalogenase